MRFAHSIFALLVALVFTYVADARILSSASADGRAQVTQVITGRSTDLVLLDGGYDCGLRPGSVCTVTRSGRTLGSVIIAESNEQSAVALILSLDSSSSINSGDMITLRPNPRI